MRSPNQNKPDKRADSLSLWIPGRVASSKNSRRLVRIGGRVMSFPSKAFEKYRKEALIQIGLKPRVAPPYKISYLFEMRGLGATDIDNMQASINDCLQDAGVIVDDKYILEVYAKKVIHQDEYQTHLKIEHLDPDSTS